MNTREEKNYQVSLYEHFLYDHLEKERNKPYIGVRMKNKMRLYIPRKDTKIFKLFESVDVLNFVIGDMFMLDDGYSDHMYIDKYQPCKFSFKINKNHIVIIADSNITYRTPNVTEKPHTKLKQIFKDTVDLWYNRIKEKSLQEIEKYDFTCSVKVIKTHKTNKEFSDKTIKFKL